MGSLGSLAYGTVYTDVDGILFMFDYTGSSTLYNGGGIHSLRRLVLETERYIFDMSSTLRTTDDRRGVEFSLIERKVWYNRSGHWHKQDSCLSSVRACDIFNHFETLVDDQFRVYTSLGEF